MVDIHDYDINCIESEILMKYDNAPLTILIATACCH